MTRKLKAILALTLIVCIVFTSNLVLANGFVRKNSFVNATGQNRINEIKKFQAMNNLVVTGTFDARTKDMLYNPDFQSYDVVKNPPTNGLWIVVNKTKKILTVYNGKEVDVKFPVALGTSATPTPSAKAKISNLAVNPAWGGMGGKYTPRAANDPLNPLGERWMGLVIPGKFGYGIHGTIRPREIGMYVSNGCIRMFNYDIENFVFPKMKSGTPVWLGTDEELNSWGVYQYVDKISNNLPETPVTPVEPVSPVETPKDPVIEVPSVIQPEEPKPEETAPIITNIEP
ncbi:MAG: L,D-transpeptidase [Neofamilia sp.]